MSMFFISFRFFFFFLSITVKYWLATITVALLSRIHQYYYINKCQLKVNKHVQITNNNKRKTVAKIAKEKKNKKSIESTCSCVLASQR